MSGSPEIAEEKVSRVLEQKFDRIHVSSFLRHFAASKNKYREGDWGASISTSGKFVEAVTKALLKFCNKPIPATRQFRAGRLLRDLEREPSSIDDTVRIVIPKCCLFIYEIANNRGARHDPEEIDPNEIDAGVIDVSLSWILGEMIRFASKRGKDPKEADDLVESLTRKVYPLFEEIDGRFYVNISVLSAEKTALLILYGRYPNRTSKELLCELVSRHGFSQKNSDMAFRRVRGLCDTDSEGMKLRGLGRQKAEELLNQIK